MSTTTRLMTKSALAVARQALDAARAALPAPASKFAKKTSTRHQRVAARAVRQFLRTDSRGVEHHLRDWSDRRAEFGLGEDVPDHSTLHKATGRRLGRTGARPSATPPPRPAAGCSRTSPGRRSTRPGGRSGTPAATTTGERARRPGGPGGRSGRPPPTATPTCYRRPWSAAARCRIGTRLGDAVPAGRTTTPTPGTSRASARPCSRCTAGAGCRPGPGDVPQPDGPPAPAEAGGPVAAGVRPAVGQPGGGSPAAGRGS